MDKCDGVSVLVSESCRLDNVDTQVINNCNSIQLSVFKGESQFIITGVYRSHCYNTNQFIISLDEYLAKITNKSNHIFCGDININ